MTPFGAALEPGGATRRTHLAGLTATPIAGTAQAAGRVEAPILVYHRFDEREPGSATVTLAAFEAQLAWLAAHGYAIAPLAAVLTELAAPPGRPARRLAAITVDDGHVSVRSALFPLIARREIPVTLFVYPSAISNVSHALTWSELKEMQGSGLVDVQSHTYWHPNFKTEKRRLSAPDYAAFVDAQLRHSRATLEQRLAKRVDRLAWPFGIVDPDLEAAARLAGYVAGFAYEGGAAHAGQDLMALPRIPVNDAMRGFAGALASRPAEPRPPPSVAIGP